MTSAVLTLVLLAVGAPAPPGTTTLVVAPGGSIAAAVARARDGDTVLVQPGTYREPAVAIRRQITLLGAPGSVLDGEGTHGLIVIAANGVTVRGLTLRNTGASQLEDRAAIGVHDARGCTIADNRIEDTFFGILLQDARDCDILNNEVRGPATRQSVGGNGIHAWQSDSIRIRDNRVTGHRDGIYFEFVTHGVVTGNTSDGNARYGLHFMFSDDCRYEENTFRANVSGIAVMYTRRVHMARNRFERNWGGSAYGLLLKDITDSEILDNTFLANTVGLYLEGANRLQVEGNTFTANGWALRIMANSQDNVITHNAFTGNSFDVGTNSRQNFSTFTENHWDRYEGTTSTATGSATSPLRRSGCSPWWWSRPRPR